MHKLKHIDIMKTKNLMIALLMTGLFLNDLSAHIPSGKEPNETKEIKDKDIAEGNHLKNTPTIVGIAAGNEAFSTLVAAVKAADLVKTLNSEGPFTVFAPTNEAFNKLPQGTVNTLLKPENKATLTAILTYHVVAGKLKAADIVKAIKGNNGKFIVTTVQGATLTATLNGAKVILTDQKGNIATVVATDVAASNGVIHALDTVVMPK